MRASRSFQKTPGSASSHRPYAGAVGGGCFNVAKTARPGCDPNCSSPWDKPKGSGRPCPPQKKCPKCPPGKKCPDCPPQKPCPPQKACPPQKPCPPQKACPDCPPQKPCPPQRACPPQKPCPPQRPCPPQKPCPEYECEDACATLHPVGSAAYQNCIRQHCNPGLITTFRPAPTIPGERPDPECIFECRERFAAGEISYAVFQQCMQDCCFAEKIAEGYSVDMARRLCSQSKPGTPTPTPTCEQRCRGQYGVNTQGYFDCVKRNCTLTSTFGVSPTTPPYIP